MTWFSPEREKEYKVVVEYDDQVTPEETLMDASSGHADIEKPIGGEVFRIAGLLGGLLLLIIGLSAGRLAVAQYEEFNDLAKKNAQINVAISPPRGLILDRNGQPLVKNTPSFDLLVVTSQLPKDLGEQAIEIRSVALLTGIAPEELKKIIDEHADTEGVFYAGTNLTKAQVVALTQAHPQGFAIVSNTARSYVDGQQFSSVLGYLGKVSREDLARDPYYLSPDLIGRAGIEANYETALRGTHGRVFFDRANRQQGSSEPKPGNDVTLNIDASIQKMLYNVLFGVLRQGNLTGAAAIAQDPRTGAVLGMVSFPGFNSNTLINDVSPAEYAQLFENKSRPLFNRVIGGLYSPGSTIKPFIGMTALEEGVVKTNDTIEDCVSVAIPNPVNPDNPTIFKNWKVDLGFFNLRKAIADSCNVYFFRAGGGLGNFDGLGITRIAKYLKKGLADIVLGIDLPGERNGFVPTPEWKRETRNEEWFQGDTYNVSIGQGDLVVTPLWLNSYVSAIANGGTIYRPWVAKSVTSSDGVVQEEFAPEVLAKLPFGIEVIREMRSDMEETVRSGTARALSDLPVRVGAKTGTAEVNDKKRLNSLFTAFAPVEDPEIALTVLIENSVSNQTYAIQTAHEFLRWYFGRTASPSVTP